MQIQQSRGTGEPVCAAPWVRRQHVFLAGNEGPALSCSYPMVLGEAAFFRQIHFFRHFSSQGIYATNLKNRFPARYISRRGLYKSGVISSHAGTTRQA